VNSRGQLALIGASAFAIVVAILGWRWSARSEPRPVLAVRIDRVSAIEIARPVQTPAVVAPARAPDVHVAPAQPLPAVAPVRRTVRRPAQRTNLEHAAPQDPPSEPIVVARPADPVQVTTPPAPQPSLETNPYVYK
jgi:hypothetical protein